VLAAWIVLVIGLAPVGAKLGDVTNDQTEAFLPKNAESTDVVKLLKKEFPGGQTVNGLVVYRRPGGLTAADKAKIADDARRAAAALPLVGAPAVPFQPGAPRALVAPGGVVAYTALSVPDNNKKLPKWGRKLDKIVTNGSGGLRIYVTGNLGFNTDADRVFGSIDAQLLLVTVVLVLVLLGLIYRSPIVALIPLLVVGVSYSVAQGFIYLYAKSGATVSSNSTSILVVLMFGVGTDYCLLLVSRYREELRRREDKHDARTTPCAARARRSWPAG
jgi:RND superfamily putative drug exporter